MLRGICQARAGTQNNFFPIPFTHARRRNACAANGCRYGIMTRSRSAWPPWPFGWVTSHRTRAMLARGEFHQRHGYICHSSDHRACFPIPTPSLRTSSPRHHHASHVWKIPSPRAPLASISPMGLEPRVLTYSREYVDSERTTRQLGGKNLAMAFGVNTNTALLTVLDPNCATTGITNAVSGVVHILKLVAGGMARRCQHFPFAPTAWLRIPIAPRIPVSVQGTTPRPTDPFGAARQHDPHSAAASSRCVSVLSNQLERCQTLDNPPIQRA